jgi:hypothetical protein
MLFSYLSRRWELVPTARGGVYPGIKLFSKKIVNQSLDMTGDGGPTMEWKRKGFKHEATKMQEGSPWWGILGRRSVTGDWE